MDYAGAVACYEQPFKSALGRSSDQVAHLEEMVKAYQGLEREELPEARKHVYEEMISDGGPLSEGALTRADYATKMHGGLREEDREAIRTKRKDFGFIFEEKKAAESAS